MFFTNSLKVTVYASQIKEKLQVYYLDHIMLIRRDLYGRDGAHLNKKGKQMMAQIKRHFQDA